MSKSTSKIVKKSSQNSAPGHPGGARSPPESLPGASQEPVGTVFETPPRLTKDLKRSGRVPEAILGAGRDPKINQKSICAQKVASEKVPGSVFHRFSVSSLFWVGFCIDFRWFSDVFFVCFFACFCLQFLYHFSFRICSEFRILSMTFQKQ